MAGGLSRIVIPTVFSEDYLDALRALSRRNDPSILVRSLEFCQRVSAACSEETVEAATRRGRAPMPSARARVTPG